MNENPALIVRAFRILKFERHNFSRRVDAVGNCVHSNNKKEHGKPFNKKNKSYCIPESSTFGLVEFWYAPVFRGRNIPKIYLTVCPLPLPQALYVQFSSRVAEAFNLKGSCLIVYMTFNRGLEV